MCRVREIKRRDEYAGYSTKTYTLYNIHTHRDRHGGRGDPFFLSFYHTHTHTPANIILLQDYNIMYRRYKIDHRYTIIIIIIEISCIYNTTTTTIFAPLPTIIAIFLRPTSSCSTTVTRFVSFLFFFPPPHLEVCFVSVFWKPLVLETVGGVTYRFLYTNSIPCRRPDSVAE